MIVEPKITKAFFVSAGKCKEKFKDAKCAFPISVGQQYHEGEKFAAAVKLLESQFKSCDIIVCDSLQRHTLEVYDDLSASEAYKKSIRSGEQWLSRNTKYIYNLEIPFKIIRWDDWLNNESYLAARDLVDSLFLENQEYNSAFILASKKFVDRHQAKQTKRLNYDSLANKCIEYLKEECAITPMWMREKYDFIVYPGERTDAMLAAYDFQIKRLNTDLLTWIRINFKRRYK